MIMATARNQSEDIVEALRLGANDYVTKPLDFPVVLARVQTQLLAEAGRRAGRARWSSRLAERNRELEGLNARLESANRRMARDLRAAARVQKSFLPQDVARRCPGVRCAWVYRPCDELAGDGLNAFAARRPPRRPLRLRRQRPRGRLVPALGLRQPGALAAGRPVERAGRGRLPGRPGDGRAAGRGRRAAQPDVPVRPGRPVLHDGLRRLRRRRAASSGSSRRATRAWPTCRPRGGDGPRRPGVPGRAGRGAVRGAGAHARAGRPGLLLLRRHPRGDERRRTSRSATTGSSTPLERTRGGAARRESVEGLVAEVARLVRRRPGPRDDVSLLALEIDGPSGRVGEDVDSMSRSDRSGRSSLVFALALAILVVNAVVSAVNVRGADRQRPVGAPHPRGARRGRGGRLVGPRGRGRPARRTSSPGRATPSRTSTGPRRGSGRTSTTSTGSRPTTPRQQSRVERLRPLVERRMAVLKANAGLRRDRGFEAARAAVVGGEGPRLMDEVVGPGRRDQGRGERPAAGGGRRPPGRASGGPWPPSPSPRRWRWG